MVFVDNALRLFLLFVRPLDELGKLNYARLGRVKKYSIGGQIVKAGLIGLFGVAGRATAITAVCLLGSPASLAQVPNVFSDGNVASATEMNQNFNHVDAMLKESVNVGPGTVIDCDADANALSDALGAGYTTIEISQGTCNLQYIGDRTVYIYGATGVGGELLAGIDSTPFSLYIEQSRVRLESLNIYGGLYPSLSSYVFDRINIDCEGLDNPELWSPLYSYMASGYVYSSSINGCNGVAIEGGSNLYIDTSTITPRDDGRVLFVASDSAIMSYENEYLASSSTEAWQVFIAGKAIFNGDVINGGMYMPAGRVNLDGVTLADNGAGVIDLAPHFGGDLTIYRSVFSDTMISTFRGGAVQIGHDPDNDHDNVDITIDGNGQLSFGGAFTGENNAVYVADGSYAFYGSWEAGSSVENSADVSLGFGGHLTPDSNVTGYTVECRDGLDLVSYSDGQTCVDLPDPVP